MVAIMVSALLGAGVSTLVMAPFGVWAVLIGMPVIGSAAGLACAVAVAGRADRR